MKPLYQIFSGIINTIRILGLIQLMLGSGLVILAVLTWAVLFVVELVQVNLFCYPLSTLETSFHTGFDVFVTGLFVELFQYGYIVIHMLHYQAGQNIAAWIFFTCPFWMIGGLAMLRRHRLNQR